MSERNGSAAVLEAPTPTVSFEAQDVTGTHTLVASDVLSTAPAGAVARSLASMMRLPETIPWALRNESTSAFLDDDKPIGDQIEPNAKVTIHPKTHLGGG